jgi:hypothetical protein
MTTSSEDPDEESEEAAAILYWSHWTPEAHAKFARITESGDGLIASADIPTWLAEITTGRLADSDAPALVLGTIAEPGIDWAALIAQHPHDLHPAGPTGPAGPTWPHLVEASALLAAAGFQSYYDLDIEVLEDARLGVRWNALGVEHPAHVIDDATWTTLSTLLTPAEVLVPVTKTWTPPGPPTPETSSSQPDYLWKWVRVEPGDGLIFCT